MKIKAHDEVRIAASAIVCQRTVKRVYAGGGTQYSRTRVAEAAEELGLPPPPDLSETDEHAGSRDHRD